MLFVWVPEEPRKSVNLLKLQVEFCAYVIALYIYIFRGQGPRFSDFLKSLCPQNQLKTIVLNSAIYPQSNGDFSSFGDIQVSLHQIVLKNTAASGNLIKNKNKKWGDSRTYYLIFASSQLLVRSGRCVCKLAHLLPGLLISCSRWPAFPIQGVSFGSNAVACTEVLRVSRTLAWGSFI